MTQTDWLADWRKAQEEGHHPECDGYRLAHRVRIVRTEFGTYAPECEECDGLPQIGSYKTEERARQAGSGHSEDVPCDGRCHSWT